MIKIICVGKLKENYLKEAVLEYAKRLSKYTKISIIELNDVSNTDVNTIIKKEQDEILKNVDLKNHAIQQQAHNLLTSFLSCNIDDIVICPTKFKGRAKMDELNLVIRNQVYGYTELYGKDEGEEYEEKDFFYIYVSKKYNNESMRNKIIEKLKELTKDT